MSTFMQVAGYLLLAGNLVYVTVNLAARDVRMALVNAACLGLVAIHLFA